MWASTYRESPSPTLSPSTLSIEYDNLVIDVQLIPQTEFVRLRQSDLATNTRLALIADMCRANALAAVKWAGSGHLGYSFGAMDIVVWLYYHRMNTLAVGYDDPNREHLFFVQRP